MRKTILVIFALLSAYAAQAGSGLGLVRLGVKGGITSPSVKFTGKNSNDIYHIGSNNNTGFHVGMFGRINVLAFHVQPELIYTRSGYDLKSWRITSPNSVEKAKVNISTIDMPVLVGLRFIWFRFQAGPVFNLWTDNDTKKDGAYDVKVNKPTMSYMMGVGFDMGRINLDVRYHGQFSKTKHNVQFVQNTPGHTYKSRLKEWQFSVGYLF